MQTSIETKPQSRLSGAGLPMPDDLPPPGGILMVKIVAGKLLRDTEFIGKMDPFVIIEIDGFKHKTHVIQGGGKAPVWNDRFEFDVGDMEQEIKI